MALSGGKGNSKANTQSSSSTVNTTTTNVDNRIYTSDAGALTAATDIATTALRSNAAALDTATALIGDSVSSSLTLADRSGARVADVALGSLSDSLTFADRQNTRVADTATSSLIYGEEIFGKAGELVSHAFQDAFDLAGGVLKEGQVQLGNTVTNLNAIAREQSTSTDERVQDIAKQALYIGAGVVALIVAAIIWSRS